MVRPKTPDVRITEALNPRAQMVQSGFSHPGGVERSSLHEVARSLMSLSSDLSAWGAKEQEREKEEAAIRGEAAFYQNNQAGYEEATRRGLIPENASPFYMRGYQRAAGSAAGFDLDAKMGAAYEQWEGRTWDGAADPNKFNQWFRSTVEGEVKSTDPSFLRGVLPHLRQMQERYHTRWQNDVRQNTQFKAEANYGALAGSTIEEYSKAGIASHTGTDVEKLGDSLDAIRENAYKSGMRQETIDKVMVDAIVAKTASTKDPSLLKLFDRNSIIGTRLGDTPYGRDEKLKLTNTLTSLYRQQVSEERIQQERLDRQQANNAKARLLGALIEDPENATLNEDLIKSVEKVDGDFRITILGWRRTIREDKSAEDPAAVSKVYDDILAGKDIDAITNAMKARVIKTPGTIASALGFLKSATDYAQSDSKILDAVAAKSYLKEIETRAQESKLSANGIFGQTSMTPQGRSALNSFRRDLIQWQLANPKVGALEREKYITERGDLALKSLQRPGAPTPSSTPPASPAAAPTAPSPAAAPPAPQQQGSNGSWQQRLLQSRDAPPSVDTLGLSSDERSQLDNAARVRGVPAQQIIDGMWRRGQQLQQGQQPPQAPAQQDPARDGRRSSLQIPGGGTIEMVGLSDDAMQAIQSVIQGRNFGPAPQHVAYTSEEDGAGGPSASRVERINRTAVAPIIDRVAREMGFDADKLKTIVSIESSGNPRAGEGRNYHGLTQLSRSEFAQYGDGGDVFNPETNLRAGIKSLRAKTQRFAQEFGREPSPTELYLMHQQGEAGARAHLRNLDQPAWKSMLSTGEGQSKGEGWARKAVWGNIPADMRGLFGSVDEVSSREFIAVWTSKVQGIPYRQALAQAGKGPTIASESPPLASPLQLRRTVTPDDDRA